MGSGSPIKGSAVRGGLVGIKNDGGDALEDIEHLQPVESVEGPTLLPDAVRVGGTRLIDNVGLA